VAYFEIPFTLSVGPNGPKSKGCLRFDSARCAGYAQRERKRFKPHHYRPERSVATSQRVVSRSWKV
ncbi:MAG TPA: hypothetical protein VFL63_12055, partial [Rhodanobacteraceae bacterium]|nr:hypothetical protein [Rhodanobacteraceae bacterium]